MSRPHQLEVSIAPGMASTPAAQAVVAVCLFLNDGRFGELRVGAAELDGYPPSYSNCIPASLLLAWVLDDLDPARGWHPVEGVVMGDWHAFVMDGQGGEEHEDVLVADCTADQFDLASALLQPRLEVGSHSPGKPLLGHRDWLGMDWSHLGRWQAQWQTHGGDYMQRAEDILAGQASQFMPRLR